MKQYGWSAVYLRLFLTSSLDGSERSAFTPRPDKLMHSGIIRPSAVYDSHVMDHLFSWRFSQPKVSKHNTLCMPAVRPASLHPWSCCNNIYLSNEKYKLKIYVWNFLNPSVRPPTPVLGTDMVKSVFFPPTNFYVPYTRKAASKTVILSVLSVWILFL
jgi:hypothetical protein